MIVRHNYRDTTVGHDCRDMITETRMWRHDYKDMTVETLLQRHDCGDMTTEAPLSDITTEIRLWDTTVETLLQRHDCRT